MVFLFIILINVFKLNPQEKKVVDEFEMSLEDLLKVKVSTAAKSPQQIGYKADRGVLGSGRKFLVSIGIKF